MTGGRSTLRWEVGRDPATVERTVSLLVDLPTATGRPSEEKPGLKLREPEELAAHLAGYADAGISHVQLMLDPNTPAGIEWAARSVEALDSEMARRQDGKTARRQDQNKPTADS
jgi:hypothetical protein